MYRTYVLTFPPYANVAQIQSLVQSHPRIASYWNYIPNVYCVKTDMSASDLANLFVMAASNFLVAEVNTSALAMGISGRLPQAAWDWFNAPPSKGRNALMS
jgi:hypothetical protein